MVSYLFSFDSANTHYISIKVTIPTNADLTLVKLPAWRPGRYELTNFAKNVKGFRIYDENNKRLEYKKQIKDVWEVDTSSTSSIRVEYSYFANELNAGSTFLDATQLYVNPVNCCVFTEETKELKTELEIKIPTTWKVACSMKQNGKVLVAENFEELVDSPFICSEHLHYNQYEVKGIVFHLWMNGEVKPNWSKLIKDFKAFTKIQIEKFTEFPVPEFHFMFHILPYKAYHGVEHLRSTVISLGPSYDVFDGLYSELLGVSSHELYHAWNVKSIRPIEMFPYDYTKENYSELGYLCEGVTTYMGDLMLYKSGVFDLSAYINEMNKQLQKHFDNHGRFNYSVAASSFDTWLDGYVPGAPARKVSIYTEGCLLAFALDVKILQASKGTLSLDTLMRFLYLHYAKQGKGVSEQDYKYEIEKLIGKPMDYFFADYIHGTKPFESILIESFDTIGMEMIHKPSQKFSMGKLGFKSIPQGVNFIVKTMYPGSPAELGGMQLEDEIIAVNACVCNGELDKWLQYFSEDVKTITVIRSGKLVECQLPEVDRNFYMDYTIKPLEKLSRSQHLLFHAWRK
jgi:predicted metalloprotease with PDZ domain